MQTTNTVGSFSVVNTTDVSKPVLGPNAELGINAFTVTAATGGTLIFRLTDTGYLAPTGPTILRNQLTLNSLTGNVNVTAFGAESNTNAMYATDVQTAGQTLTALGTSVVTSPLFTPNPAGFSLTEYIQVTFGTGGGNVQLTKNLTTSTVPEPSSVVLFGGVALFVSALMRRRARKVVL